MELEYMRQTARFVAGSKQTFKAIENGLAERVILARDAEERVLHPVIDICREKNIPVSYTDTMEELGKACGIKVKAAMAAILSDD